MAALFGQLLAIEMLEDEERDRGDRLHRRLIRDVQDPFSISETEFISNFRLSKEAVLDLVDDIGRYLGRGTYSNRVPNVLRVLAALHFFAVGSYQRSVGNSFLACMSQPMISRSIRAVSTIIVRHLLNRWVRFPKNNAEREDLKQKFFVRHRMRHIIGVVDGTHIAIVTPNENENAFVNRKGYHSLNVQVICDSDLTVTSVVARWPGSTHDAFVWRSSRVGSAMRANYENRDHDSRIMGDSGYPCLPWLIVPVPHPNNVHQERFNNRFKRVRSTVERCIGVLKARWRCLLKDRTLHYKPHIAAKITMTCAILHNMAIYYRLDNPEPIFDEIDLDLPEVNDIPIDAVYRQLGQQSRNDYIQRYF